MVTSDDLEAAAEITNDAMNDVRSLIDLIGDRPATNRELLRFSSLSEPTNLVSKMWLRSIRGTESGQRRIDKLMPEEFPDSLAKLMMHAMLLYEEVVKDVPRLDIKMAREAMAKSLEFIESHDHMDRISELMG